MRPIKFRAWDKQKSEWYQPTHQAYRGELFELMVGFKGDLLAHTMKGIEHESLWPDRFALMQFTGLHDKNGKEIYEGDCILEENSELDPVPEDKLKAVQAEIPSIYFERWVSISGKVIGNIYENPELLDRS